MGEFFQIQVGRPGQGSGHTWSRAPSWGLFICPSLPPAQDDYLDLFGDPSVTGKIGTDIQDNKCSWLVVQCLQRASPEQRQLLQVLGRPRIPELPGKGTEQGLRGGRPCTPGDVWRQHQQTFSVPCYRLL